MVIHNLTPEDRKEVADIADDLYHIYEGYADKSCVSKIGEAIAKLREAVAEAE